MAIPSDPDDLPAAGHAPQRRVEPSDEPPTAATRLPPAAHRAASALELARDGAAASGRVRERITTLSQWAAVSGQKVAAASRYVTVEALLRAGRWARREILTREFVGAASARVAAVAVAGFALAFSVDFALQARGGIRVALGGALAGGALAALAAALAGPLVALLALVTRAAGAIARILRPLPAALAAAAWAAAILDEFAYSRRDYRLALAGAAAVGLAAFGLWRRASATASAIAVALCIALLAADLHAPHARLPDLHQLLGSGAWAFSVAAAAPLARGLERLRLPRLLAGLGIGVLALLGILAALDPLFPGWQRPTLAHARFAPRLIAGFRETFDLDGDGFSAVAWGGDCNDLDRAQNPLGHEDRPGADRNCNGERLPESPTDEDRGLAPPVGDPDLAPDQVRRVILVTIDCLRADAFRPEVMPHLSALAARGLHFTRAYAAGSRTHLSMPLVLRTDDAEPTVATRLALAGVSTAAILAFVDDELGDTTVRGFREVRDARTLHADPRAAGVPASAITAAALDWLSGHPPSERSFLWLHYFDAHMPYLRPREGAHHHPSDPGMPREHGPYLDELSAIDDALGQLFDGLTDADGLAHTAIVVTADHGEGFGEHGLRYHGVSAFEPVLRVPAVLYAPGLPAGLPPHRELVSHRDIPATILGAFGLVAADPSVEVFGRSWLRLRARPDLALHRFVVVRSARGDGSTGFAQPLAAIVAGPLKLVKSFEDGFSELYDLEADPGEQIPLGLDDPRRRPLERALERYRDLDRYP